MPPPRQPLRTNRLLLRPSDAADAARAFAIQSDWEVTRMLSLASFPPDRQEIDRWFAEHPREWDAGSACRFAVLRDDVMIGLVDIDGIRDREGTLGYWLDHTAWGHGYAFEAAQALTRLADQNLGLLTLKAGHADDNPASGRILTRLGFTAVDSVALFSRPRNQHIAQRCYVRAFSD